MSDVLLKLNQNTHTHSQLDFRRDKETDEKRLN